MSEYWDCRDGLEDGRVYGLSRHSEEDGKALYTHLAPNRSNSRLSYNQRSELKGAMQL